MKIAFYAPFKPLDHPVPSGDRFIGRSIVRFLESRGHEVRVQSRLRARWIYWKPWLWPVLFRDYTACLRRLKNDPPDLWMTYHAYYKAPDLLGPWVSRRLGIPYVIFQGIYSTRPGRKAKTALGFHLNRLGLLRADHVFTNRREDLVNLERLLPDTRLTFVRPGLQVSAFTPVSGTESGMLRNRQAGGVPVIGSAAMFRDDVKTKGLAWLIRCCQKLSGRGVTFELVIAGSGPMESYLKALAEACLPGRVRFLGNVDRKKMQAFYRSVDVFAFPGYRESLGMVFLEAQACGIPVVAFDNGGIPEVVADGRTGFLVPVDDWRGFSGRLQLLLEDTNLRRRMGDTARTHVETAHDSDRNFIQMEAVLTALAAGTSMKRAG